MLVVVGRIGRAHGLRGEVSVEVRTDEPEVRFADRAVLASDDAGGRSLTVVSTRHHHGRLLVHFDGVEDRTAAEGLAGRSLWVEVDPASRPDDPDEFYIHSLVGLTATTADAVPVGVVVDVVPLPGQDLLVLKADDGREVLVPFVEQFVPTIDPGAGVLVVAPPPGLLELG